MTQAHETPRWFANLQVRINGAIVLLMALPVIAAAQNTVYWTTNYYSVTGATVGEIHQSLSRNRPWKDKSTHHGLTDWRIQWRYQVASSPGECRLAAFTTTTTITVTLPRWMRPSNALPEATTNWSRYITALGQHEAGHAQHGLAAAAEQHRRVPQLASEMNCDALKKRIDDLAQQIVDEYGRRDREYDERTGHGAKQGASLRGGFRTGERLREQ